jgi:cadmium resistance protein CadD (predicted permease)
MTPIISLMAIGVSAFAATNIDDIFVLMVFFCIDSSSSIEY